MKKNLLLLFFWLFPLFMWAQAPAGYYTNADSKSGAELKTALYNIIKGHTTVSYDGLYSVYPTSDNLPGNIVWDMYSVKADGTAAYYYTQGNKKCGNYSKEGECYNREHSMPQSWFNSSSPMVSDAFHVYPTDGKVNGIRSSYPFGEVLNATNTSSNGSMLGSCDPATGYSGTVFEPIDAFKGDFARTYFYMATRYEDKIASWTGNGTAGLILDGTAYPAYKSWYLQTMLKWHRQDPVSQKEIDRNNAVYAIQHNRNPYIDNPQYAEYVWGGETPSGVSISAITKTPEFPNETNTVSVSATVTGTKTITAVKLKWGLTAAFGNEITMNKTTGDAYQSATAIPVQALNETIYYAVFAQDAEGGSSTSATKTYTVGNSLVISSIATTPTTPNETNTVLVTATVNSATTLSSVKLFWGLTATPTTEIAMSTSGSNSYTATIPAQAVGAKVYYYVSALNTTPATVNSATTSYTVASSVAPTNLISEDFASCLPADWITLSITSNKNWTCISTAFEMNNFGGDVASEDWLITKKVDATSFKSIALSFKVKTKYTDANYPNTLTVYYSTNFTGTGNPNAATWNKLTYTVPTANSNVFVSSGNIDIAALEGKQFYIGFKYVSSGVGSNSAALWGVDDVLLVGTPTAGATNQAPIVTAVQHTPANPVAGDIVAFSANVTDADGTVNSVSLLYGEDETSLDQSATMTLTTGSTYTTSLVFPSTAKFYFKVEATDNLDLAATSAVVTVTAAVPENQIPVVASVQHTPETPAVAESVTYSASVTDTDGTVKSVTLKYGTAEGTFDQIAAMALTTGSTYASTFAFPNTTKLYYKVEAVDNIDMVATSPIITITAAAPTNQAPSISNISVTPTAPQQGAAITISATATDSDGSIVEVKVLHGTSAENLSGSLSMNLVSGNSFSGATTAPQAGAMFFKVEATDNLGLKTITELQTVNLTTGIGQISTDAITLYPNPASNELKISLHNQSAAKVEIYNLTGKLLVGIKEFTSDETIDISALRNGIYMVRISSGNTTITKKITVSK